MRLALPSGFRSLSRMVFRTAASGRRRRPRLFLERLEDRTLLATTTFAQFQPLNPSLQAFLYTNTGKGTATFQTVQGGDPVLVSFDSNFVSGLGTGPVNAHLFLNASTDQAVTPPPPGSNDATETFPSATNTLVITLDTPVNGKSNFLSVTYSDVLEGQIGLTEASHRASDSAQPPDTVTFTSDFIDFSNSVNHGFSLAFSSLNSNDGSGGLQIAANGFFKSFSASGTGTFDTNFASLGQLSGQKFVDTNGNGVLDAGEPGMAGVVIDLLDPTTNQVLFSTTTDANGNFSFTNLPSGTYRIREEEQTGFVQTTPNPADITVTRGSDITGIDFGNFQLAQLSGQKFVDVNGNGVLDAGEPGLGGVVIDLLNATTGALITTTTTDASGNFSFTGLGPGTYRLREESQAGFTQTTANPADITLTSGANISGIDFGNFQLAKISGLKFEDINGNGVQDTGEPGLANFTIDLFNATTGALITSTTTDASGDFSFTGLGPGSYRLREVQQAGFTQTTVNPADITLTSGADITGIKFGNQLIVSPALVGQIHGVKFEDLNANGVRDANEPGLGGFTIELLNPRTGQVEFTTTTSATGAFSFTSIPVGSFRIREVQKTGFVLTTALPGDITLTAGADITGIVFGNAPSSAIGGVGGGVIPGVMVPIISKVELLASNFPLISLGLLQAEEGFVNGLFNTLLGRAPDVAGLTDFVLLMQSGISRQQILQIIWQSPEHRALEVNQFYEAFLGRPADAAGRAFFVNALLNGATELDVMQAILSSAEYQASHASNLSFLTGLYAQVLGRSADTAGLTAWLQLLQSGGFNRAQVVHAFLTSAEADQRFVEADYLQFLGRPADSAGLQFWTNLLVSGQASLQTVGEAITASDEFFARLRLTT